MGRRRVRPFDGAERAGGGIYGAPAPRGVAALSRLGGGQRDGGIGGDAPGSEIII